MTMVASVAQNPMQGAPQFGGKQLSPEMRRMLVDYLSGHSSNRDQNILYNKCGDSGCKRIDVLCVKPVTLDEVARLNGNLERTSVGIEVLFKDSNTGVWGKQDFVAVFQKTSNAPRLKIGRMLFVRDVADVFCRMRLQEPRGL